MPLPRYALAKERQFLSPRRRGFSPWMPSGRAGRAEEADSRLGKFEGLVAHFSGNHGAGLARGTEWLGLQVLIAISGDAPPKKN